MQRGFFCGMKKMFLLVKLQKSETAKRFCFVNEERFCSGENAKRLKCWVFRSDRATYFGQMVPL